jgi:DNA-binding XRE family transcriptional regulator
MSKKNKVYQNQLPMFNDDGTMNEEYGRTYENEFENAFEEIQKIIYEFYVKLYDVINNNSTSTDDEIDTKGIITNRFEEVNVLIINMNNAYRRFINIIKDNNNSNYDEKIDRVLKGYEKAVLEYKISFIANNEIEDHYKYLEKQQEEIQFQLTYSKFIENKVKQQFEERICQLENQSIEPMIKTIKELTENINFLMDRTNYAIETVEEIEGKLKNEKESSIDVINKYNLFAGAGGLNLNNKDSQPDLIAKDSKGNLYIMQAILDNNKSKIKGVSIPKGNYDISKLSIEENTFEKYMKEHGINQTLLSVRTGISRSSLINIMKSPSNISLTNARKIAIALNESVDVLFPPLDTE